MTAISGLAQNYLQLLLARIGVGVGEAGGSPPSHSIISDIFPPEQRATALGFFTTGASFGVLFGFLLGGWLNEFFGWRVAFFVVGVPGILLAVLVRLTLAEPIRGMSEQRTVSDQSVSTWQVLKLLWSRRTFRHLATAAALNAFASFSANNWLASFFIRSHGMSTGELGTWLALVLGLGGAVGVFFGAMLSDHLARRDKRWYAWLPALAGVTSVPFSAATYLAGNPYVALAMAAVPGVLLSAYVGNTLAVTHGLVGLRMRALSSAVLFFVLNIVGMGAGPWSVGMLSDYLTPATGSAALGWAMLLLLPAAMLWSSVHFYLAAGTLRQDLEAAPA